MLVVTGYKKSSKVIIMNREITLLCAPFLVSLGFFCVLVGCLCGFCLILVLVFCITLVFLLLFRCNINSSEISAFALVAHAQALKNNFS